MKRRKAMFCTVLAMAWLTTATGFTYGDKTVASSEEGMERYETAVENLCEEIRNQSNINTAIILKNGSIVLAYDKNGYNEDSVVALNSCAKSITSILIGIAIDQGLIESVDTKIVRYFPALENDADDLKKEIAIKHLLAFTPGFDWPEWGSWNYWPGEFVASDNWVDFVLDRPMIAEPGEQFAYNTGASQLLSAILQKVSGQDAFSFAEENLFAPLDIHGVQWGKDPQGITTGGFQFSMKPSDAAKIGQLYLNKGFGNGKQIVSEAWVTESTQAHAEGGYFGSQYGYHWWVENGSEADYYYAMGYGGQYIFIAPEFNIVAVFTSNLPMQQIGLPKTYFETLIHYSNGVSKRLW